MATKLRGSIAGKVGFPVSCTNWTQSESLEKARFFCAQGPEVKCRLGGPEYDQPTKPSTLWHTDARLEVVACGEGHRPKGLRSGAWSGVGGGHPGNQKQGCEDSRAVRPLGAGTIPHSAPPGDRPQVRLPLFGPPARSRESPQQGPPR